MPERLDRHGDRQARDLFEQNTAQVGALGDLIDARSSDSIRLGQPDESVGGVDAGESDFEAEMNPDDPPEDWEEADDSFPAQSEDDEKGIGETDITGTAAGIARGFGSHLPLDLGKDGFQIEEIPTAAMGRLGSVREGEELDDYDDDDPNNGKFDPRELETLSIPGRSPVKRSNDDD